MKRQNIFDRSGDTSSPTIMWIGIILAVLICISWFLIHLQPAQQEVSVVQYDMQALRSATSDACNSVQYAKVYNPHTEQGTLSSTAGQVCINSTHYYECMTPACSVSIASAIDLSKISTITIQGQSGNISITGT